MRFYYQVYGLHLDSNVDIPGLNAEKSEKCEADIKVNMGFFPNEILGFLKYPNTEYYLEPGYEKRDPPHLVVNKIAGERFFHFNYDEQVEFVINQDATLVWCIWKTPLVLEDVALYLLGPIIGFMLRLRGITCLHASGIVATGNNAFALTGESGAGKSTLAASFATTGHSILTDDVLPLTIEKEIINAQPGYSRLRLYPNSFKNMEMLPNELPLLAPSWDKCYLDLSSKLYTLNSSPAPLKVIYIIDWSEKKSVKPSIEVLNKPIAVALLAANTYRNELLNSGMKANEFAFLSQLVNKVKVKRFSPINDISAIPLLSEMILDDFKRESINA